MKASVKVLTRNVGKVVSKNSPIILTGLGVAGVVTTTVMAVKATPKALQLLEEERQIRTKETGVGHIDLKDGFLITWKCYIPTSIMGALTIACIVGANSINTRRNAALATVYSLSEAALKEYQTKVVETIGKGKEQKIKDDIAKDRLQRNPVSSNEIIMTGKGETLCYDSLSGRYFKSDIEEIRRICNDMSRDLMTEMFIPLNRLYSDLGLFGTKVGDNVGWHIDDGIIEPQFSSQLTETGVPCLVMDFTIEPRYGYNNF